MKMRNRKNSNPSGLRTAGHTSYGIIESPDRRAHGELRLPHRPSQAFGNRFKSGSIPRMRRLKSQDSDRIATRNAPIDARHKSIQSNNQKEYHQQSGMIRSLKPRIKAKSQDSKPRDPVPVIQRLGSRSKPHGAMRKDTDAGE
jgi:hypothetical protein